MDADCVTAEQQAARIRELRTRYVDILFEVTMAGKNPEKDKRLIKIESRLESLFVRYKETSRNELIHELASLGGNR